jgi:O-antigen/teichoic acid export membrane protein
VLTVPEIKAGELRRTTARGAVVAALGQAIGFVLRVGSMIILARLLVPRDFGLVGMVTAVTGFLGLFRDAGLSMASVQRASVTEEQTSTLFWINVAVGGILAALCCVSAPVLVWFYGEPRLLAVSIVVGSGFVFNGVGAQHRARLQRALRFGALTAIDSVAMGLSILIAVCAAAAGAGYWAVVVMTVSPPAIALIGMWVATGWVPGRPARGAGVRSMLWYGGTVTLNSVVMYCAYNLDKVLIGRVWGADVLGVYGRAYQLMTIPTENLNSTLGLVAFPTLSRLQGDEATLRKYFLAGYGAFQSVSIPITATCLLFAEDIVRVFLGPKWMDVAVVFRVLAPTIFVFGLINPLAWWMLAEGRAARSLKIAVVIAPVVVMGYALGLKGGATGVAAGFSVSMVILAIPVVLWARHATALSMRDVGTTILSPVVAVLAGAVGGYAVHQVWADGFVHAFPRLLAEAGVLWTVYAFVLLGVLGQRAKYLPLLRETGLWPGSRIRA